MRPSTLFPERVRSPLGDSASVHYVRSAPAGTRAARASLLRRDRGASLGDAREVLVMAMVSRGAASISAFAVGAAVIATGLSAQTARRDGIAELIGRDRLAQAAPA